MKKQVIKYKVTFEKAPEYNAIYEIQLTKSGAFKYGNGTCVIVLENGKRYQIFDTRYETGIIENFEEWCKEYIEHAFDQDYLPHIEKIE